MRVPACTPKRGHSSGNATAVLKGLVSSVQERAKAVTYRQRGLEAVAPKTLLSRRWTRPHTVETKAQSRVAPTTAPDRGRAHGKGIDVKSPPSRVSGEGERRVE